MTKDLLTLKLYVADDGEVWYINMNGPPVATGMSCVAFLLHPLSQEFPHMRLVGFPQNMQLILALYLRDPQREAVEICGPLVCRTKAERHDPARVLYAMRQYEQARSMGGWHTFTRQDYFSFALTMHLDKMGHVDDQARYLLHKHCAWSPLSFIPHLNEDACAGLLALIVDPRWYINPVNPTRGSKLRRFLGLDFNTMLGVFDEGPPQMYHDRCKLVMNAWDGPKNLKLVERPDYFLWRIRRAAWEKEPKNYATSRHSTHAKLRMSQAFVEYLRLTWLAELGRGRHQNDSLFVPEYFFQEKYETKAFKEHMHKAQEIIHETGENPPKR